MGLFVLVSAAVCAFSFVQGNVLAPLFGLINLWLLHGILGYVRRQGDASDCVRFDGRMVQVVQRRGNRVAELSFDPLWIRLERCETRHGLTTHVGSHGRLVEVGRFLAGSRKQQLVVDLNRLIEQARSIVLSG